MSRAKRPPFDESIVLEALGPMPTMTKAATLLRSPRSTDTLQVDPKC
jgi:hypothetical protein